MAIKRVIYEVDDSPGEAVPTHFPDALRSAPVPDYQPKQITGTPAVNDTEDNQPRAAAPAQKASHGRTYSDLVVELQHSPRAMATVLTIIGFAPFVMRLAKAEDVILPLIVSAILNAVWFGVPVLTALFRWLCERFR